MVIGLKITAFAASGALACECIVGKNLLINPFINFAHAGGDF